MPLSLSTPARSRLKELALCVSLGNLCFLPRWLNLERLHTQAMNYYRSGPANQTLLIATLIASILVGLVFWFAELTIREWGGAVWKTIARTGFLAVILFALESMRQYGDGKSEVRWGWNNLLFFAAEIALVTGVAMTLGGELSIFRMARSGTFAAIFLLPAVLIDFAWIHTGWEPASSFQSEASLPLLAPHESAKPSVPRLVWIIFDEFDQGLAFDARPESVQLPEMDRLRSESMVANGATQTEEWTDYAIPTLLSGRVFSDFNIAGANRLMVLPVGSREWSDWRDQPNVFERARDLGINAAIVGWHFPYCRILGDKVTRCFAASGGPPDSLQIGNQAAQYGILRSVVFLFQLRWASLVDIFSPRTPPRDLAMIEAHVQERQLDQYTLIRDRALRDAVDRQIGLVYIHVPVPHPYGIYDRQRKDFRLTSSTSYLDNLALADRMVGRVRRALKQAGLWESTSLLITGDHGLRPWLWSGRYNWSAELDRLMTNGPSGRVPFILKLAGHTDSVVYYRPFFNFITGGLVEALLSGEVSTPAGAAHWLSDHTSDSQNRANPLLPRQNGPRISGIE